MKIKKNMIKAMASQFETEGASSPIAKAEVEFEKQQRYSTRKALAKKMHNANLEQNEKLSTDEHHALFRSKLLDEIHQRSDYEISNQNASRDSFYEMLRVSRNELNMSIVNKAVDRFLELVANGNDAVDERRLATYTDTFAEHHREWKVRVGKDKGCGGVFLLIVMDGQALLFDDTRQMKYILTA